MVGCIPGGAECFIVRVWYFVYGDCFVGIGGFTHASEIG